MKFRPTFKLVSQDIVNKKGYNIIVHTHIWSNPSNGWNNATIQGKNTALVLVHQAHGTEHAR